MRTQIVSHEKRALFLFVSLITFCLTPVLGNAQVFEPSHNYPLSDYETFGMLFTPRYQKVVDNLTKQLLENERSAGYFGGDHQEYAIREKVKRHIAMSRGLRDRKSIEKDDSPNQAVRATNEYLKKWREQMQDASNTAEIKAEEEKRYQAAYGAIKDQQDAREDYEQRRRAPKKYTPEQLEAIYRALDAKYADMDRIDREKAIDDRLASCRKFCNQHHWGLALIDCMKACRDY